MKLTFVYLFSLFYYNFGFIQQNITPPIKPKYNTIGNWSLKGTSASKFSNQNIILEIKPRKNLKNLSVNLTKFKNVGPVCYKDSINGIVFCRRLSNNELNYKFKPNAYSINIITLFGVEIPDIIYNKKKLVSNLKIDNINWQQQNNLLLLNINNEYYIFQRNLSDKEYVDMIKLDHFIISQILGYCCFKFIDHFHLIS